MAMRAPELDREQRALLGELFAVLDKNGDGKLARHALWDIEEFKLFGKAISGKEVTDTQARMQINRADRNNDQSIDLEEFLAFSSMLGRLPPDEFRAVVSRYTVKVKEEMKKKAQAQAAAAAAAAGREAGASAAAAADEAKA